MGARIRGKDWSATPLGPLHRWPTSLLTLVRMMLANRFPMLIWWGPELLQVYNDGYALILGDKHPAALGNTGPRTWAEIWPVVGPMVEDIRAGGPSVWHEHLPLLMDRKGFPEQTYFTFSYSPVPDDAGALGGVLITCQETTDMVVGRQRLGALADTLRASEDYLRRVVDATGVGSWEVRLADDAVVADARMRALFWLPPEGPVSLEDALARVHPDDAARVRAAIAAALAGEDGGRYRVEPRLVSPRGEERWVDARGQASFAEGRPVRFLGTVLDITARKRVEEERERLVAELGEAVRLRDEFLSIASHELKTPLTSLSLRLQAFGRLTPEDAARRMGADLDVMRRQLVRLNALVNELLDVARISTGRLLLDPEEVDLQAVVREVVGRFHEEAERSGTPLEVHAEAPVRGRYDRLRLEQVLTNLLSNALKYGPGKPVRVGLGAEGGWARITVRDEGIGIAPEAAARIFEKFERAVSERNYGGLGLGLFVTRQIVTAMGGKVGVHSRPGEGATFTLELPL
jgi:PAS domain S-box-containing protein